ncbi:MAG: hypothetical protein JO366_21210 [Methylobacteriaceae bacterium]|nr:hypothetical protein [Methylobacteriaceae bacterium]MBV9247322.1 hypothetical protein [Methylobacteriaceae bacterium]MBV9636281.1 hypothetical protein [Methylobacteriaceae bacterium]
MTAPTADTSAKPKVENARDLLVCLYRDIGISAVAAAVAMARRPAPEPTPPEIARKRPAPGGNKST